jgi:high-affinity Fe2+/Pb2+ permease
MIRSILYMHNGSSSGLAVVSFLSHRDLRDEYWILFSVYIVEYSLYHSIILSCAYIIIGSILVIHYASQGRRREM